MQNSDWQLVKTEDGSYTLYSELLGENYHSLHGAKAESMHVYILNGLLNKSTQNQLSILEVGLGTGLNCILTVTNKPNGQTINYSALEPFPISTHLQIELHKIQENQEEATLFNVIHDCSWEKPISLFTDFQFEKLPMKFEDFVPNKTFDIIYYDAFGAHLQAEMWSEENCMKLYKLLKNNGIVITYCAKGSFKRNLRSVGFILEPLPGPVGKREITRARKLD